MVSSEWHASQEASKPAPGALRLVQDMVNSREPEEGTDDWQSPEDLKRWLVGRGLLDPDAPFSGLDVARAKEVREALRSLLLANAGEPVDPAAVAVLDAVGAPLAIRFLLDGTARLAPAGHGVDAALAHIVGIVYAAMADGTWARLKACRRQSCMWAFYDLSRNQSGSWCSMAVCGNREKTREYRRRKGARE